MVVGRTPLFWSASLASRGVRPPAGRKPRARVTLLRTVGAGDIQMKKSFVSLGPNLPRKVVVKLPRIRAPRSDIVARHMRTHDCAQVAPLVVWSKLLYTVDSNGTPPNSEPYSPRDQIAVGVVPVATRWPQNCQGNWQIRPHTFGTAQVHKSQILRKPLISRNRLHQ